MLANYNEGRSCSLFCIAAALMPVDLVKKAENKAKRRIVGEKIQADIDLKLRKKPK